jgi:hypothetical protein
MCESEDFHTLQWCVKVLMKLTEIDGKNDPNFFKLLMDENVVTAIMTSAAQTQDSDFIMSALFDKTTSGVLLSKAYSG